MATDLKPCPFCGAVPQQDKDAEFLVNCPKVGCAGRHHDPVWEDRWNRRAPRLSPEEREAMEQVRQFFAREREKISKEAYATIRKMLEESKAPPSSP